MMRKINDKTILMFFPTIYDYKRDVGVIIL